MCLLWHAYCGYTGLVLLENIINKENIIFAELNDELWVKLQEDLNHGALVVGMGAGSIDKWMRQKS